MATSPGNLNRESAKPQEVNQDALDREADRILEGFTRQRALRPIFDVRAWDALRPYVLRTGITEGELRLQWHQVKQAQRSGNRELLDAAVQVFCRDLIEFLEP